MKKILAHIFHVQPSKDGFFGKKTESMVKKYQIQEGLLPDGIITHGLWDKLLYLNSKSYIS
jgi:peptidoglycan hydrolase-like protein with peptidoglycan-binding domain